MSEEVRIVIAVQIKVPFGRESRLAEESVPCTL